MTEAATNRGIGPQAPKVLPKSLKRAIWFLQSRQLLTAGIVRASVRAANIQLDELLPWVELSHSAWKSYDDCCLYDTGALEIGIRSWAPGDFSAIYANADVTWEVVRCFGGMNFYTYVLQNEVLRADGEKPLRPGEVLQIDGGTILQMGNSGRLPAVTLHLRYRDRACRAPKAPTRIFNLFAGEIQENHSGAHFNILATPPAQSTTTLSGDWETSLRYHQHLRDRLRQILREAGSELETIRENLQVVEQRIASLQASIVA